jgi:hypothetical protein
MGSARTNWTLIRVEGRDRSRGADSLPARRLASHTLEAMARRADPERIFTARRMAVRNTLASEVT